MKKSQESLLSFCAAIIERGKVGHIEFYENGELKLITGSSPCEEEKTVGFETGGQLLEGPPSEEEEEEEGEAPTARRIGFR